MRLVYKSTQAEVKLGDPVTVRDVEYVVGYFRPLHSLTSSGRVSLVSTGVPRFTPKYYVGVIGAEWIEREDRT